MRAFEDFVDEREPGGCAYCGTDAPTRDHVPAQIFLDTPLPANTPVVPSCLACNQSASTDEEYVACLVEVARCGSTEPLQLTRPKVARTLARQVALRARLDGALVAGGVVAEVERVGLVVAKMARGLARYELGRGQWFDVEGIFLMPTVEMTEADHERFDRLGDFGLLPEIGSRLFSRICTDGGENHWEMVQPGRFQYRIDLQEGGCVVRLLLSDYLACRVDLRET